MRVYALEKDSLLESSSFPVDAFHSEAFRKRFTESAWSALSQTQLEEEALTFIDLLYPLIDLLQAESSFIAAIVLIRVDVQDLLVGPGQGSSKTTASVRDDPFPGQSLSSQGKQRVLQSCPVDHDIPLGFAERFHCAQIEKKLQVELEDLCWLASS